MTKENKNPEYAAGYGQAKADIFRTLSEAVEVVHSASRFSMEKPTPEQMAELHARMLALRWVRTLVRAATPKKIPPPRPLLDDR